MFPRESALNLMGMNAPSSTMLPSLRNPPDTHTQSRPTLLSLLLLMHAPTLRQVGLGHANPLTWGILTVQNGRSQDPPAKPACREDSLAFPF